MSGFLDTLLLRAAGQAETLAPRLPSLYETRLRGAAWADDGFVEPPAERAQAVRPPPVMPARQALVVAAPAPATPVQPAPAAPPRLAPSEPLPPDAAEAPLYTVRSTVPAPASAEPRVPPPAAVLRPRASDGPAGTGPVPPVLAGPGARPAPAPIVEPAPAPREVPPSARRPVQAEVTLAAASQARRDEPRRESTLAPRRAQSPQPQSARVAAPAPDVHITIGRVEVRALPAAARQARAGGAAQAVTLEQYLSRRNGQGAR